MALETAYLLSDGYRLEDDYNLAGGYQIEGGYQLGAGKSVPLGPAVPVVYRTSTLDELDIFGTNNQGSAGRWAVDASGSTPSSSTGPGSNSLGPYCFVESSSSAVNSIQSRSRVTLLVTNQWPRATGRTLRLEACLQGAFSADGDGWIIQSRLAAGSDWEEQRLIRGWAYATDNNIGDTIADYDAVDHECSRNGGWILFDIPIPDGHADVRMQLKWTAGSASQHDAALWQAELRND